MRCFIGSIQVKGFNGVAQVGFCVRSSPWVARCRDVIRSGAIGEPVLLWFNMAVGHDADAPAWRHDPDAGGSKLMDCCCHYLDILNLLGGGRWQRVCAFGGPPGSVGPTDRPPEVTQAIVELDNGVRLTLNLSERTRAPNNSAMGVFGTSGKILADPWLPEGAGELTIY